MGSQDCASLVVMLAMGNNSRWFQVSLFAWLSVWMVLVPLFHVHPEGDHLHGAEEHVHGSIVHTVFSPDLEEEYNDHQHTTADFGDSTPNHDAIAGHLSLAVGFAELAFSFLNDSTDRKLLKPLFVHLLVVEPSTIILSPSTNSIAQPSESLPRQTFFTRDIPTRAPPSLSV